MREKYLLVAKQHKVMKIYLQAFFAISILGISATSINAMETVSADKKDTVLPLAKVVSFDSLSRSNSIEAEEVEFDDSHSINLSSTDQKLSLENGVQTDYTKIWREGLGEPEKNSLQVTLVRF